MGRRGGVLVVCGMALAMLVFWAACGGGSGTLTEEDLFTRMIGWYDAEGAFYQNGVLSSSWERCESLEPYNTWNGFFEDIDEDTGHPGFVDSSLEYSSDSVRYEWSWEKPPGPPCTEFEEYVFGNGGATYSYVREEVCDGDTHRWEATGTRLGTTDTANDLIREAVPLDLDTLLAVTFDEGDWDFFTFTLDGTMTVDTFFENFTGTVTGMEYGLYYGERWGPAGGSSGSSIPSRDITQTWYDLEARTYYMYLFAPECYQAGTFDLTISEAE